MVPGSSSPPWLRGEGGRFATTRWSMVLAAGGEQNSQSQKALEDLCRTYWYPLYVFSRRRGYSSGDAQNLVQEFFASLLERRTLAAADADRGRFRTFLLTVYERFLGRQRERNRAQKRGGGNVLVGFDIGGAEDRYRREPCHELTPERIYERRYALTLLDEVLSQLEADYTGKNKAMLFEELKGTLIGAGDTDSYAEIAQRLGMTTGAVKVAAHRLRRDYRDKLRAEIAQTVGSAGEIDDELGRLLAALGDGA